MRILVIGGHSRSVGKTSLVVDLIRAFPEVRWTAVKITQYGHGVCSVHGDPCDCAPRDHKVALDEEFDHGESPDGESTDTSRFLRAGATRAFWLRTPQSELAEGMPLLREALRGAQDVIVESNAILQLIRPQLYLVALEPAQADFKATALRYLDRADAYVLRSALGKERWPEVSRGLLKGRPKFIQPLGEPIPQELVDFVARRFLNSMQPKLPY
jgi:molybdopterin-guanine dinucleotide biosynthesis protein